MKTTTKNEDDLKMKTNPKNFDDPINKDEAQNKDDIKTTLKGIILFMGEVILHKVTTYSCGICCFALSFCYS